VPDLRPLFPLLLLLLLLLLTLIQLLLLLHQLLLLLPLLLLPLLLLLLLLLVEVLPLPILKPQLSQAKCQGICCCCVGESLSCCVVLVPFTLCCGYGCSSNASGYELADRRGACHCTCCYRTGRC
jgi:hypothetical protein